ncbi:MAG: TonB-dependent receptor [Rubricoccaceae bacterium]
MASLLARGYACALVLLALWPVAAAAQQATVSGVVRDAASGETLIQANVVVEGTTRGVATNVQGFYSLAGLAPGEVTLVATFIGYQPQRQTVTLAAGEARRLDFALRAEGVRSAEVVVQGKQRIEEERAVGVQEVPIRLVEQLPTVFEKDLFRSVQLLPGVKASSDFSSKLYIRGGSPDQTLILLDGTTVYNPTHFFGFFSTFNTEAIKDVRLYKGAYPATYGGRLGSVIDVYNRDGNRNRMAGNVSLGLLASRAGVEGPIARGRGSYMLAGRRSTLEPLLGVLREQLDEQGIPESFYFYDFNGKVGIDLSPSDRISLAGYAGRDLVRIPFAADARFSLDYGNQTASLAYNRILSPTAFLQTRGTFSRYFSTPVGVIAGTEFERPNFITDFSARADLEWLPGERFELATGAWGGYLDLRLQSRFNGETQIDFESPSAYGSGYVQGRFRPTPDWILTAGLRGEYFQRGDYFRLSPQAQVERRLGDDTVVQLAAGRYHQFLSLISNEAFSGFDTWVTTGEGVPPQQSEQVVLGLKTRLSPAYRLDVEVYGRTLRDVFDTRPGLQDVSGLDYRDLFRFGEGYAYGAEFLIEKGLGRLTGLLGYTFAVTRRRYPDEPGFQQYFAPKYDRLHDLTLVAQLDLGRGWSWTSAGTYATGQAYTEPTAYYEVDTIPVLGGGLPGFYTSVLNGARLPAYHRVDTGFAREGRFFNLGSYELQLQAVNVYNRRNVWFVQLDTSQTPVRRTPVRQLPILPNVSLSVRF